MERAPFTACLAQISPRLGEVEANFAMHVEAMAEADERGARLVLFPELALTGYRLRDLTYELALGPEHPLVGRLAALSKGGPDFVTSYVEESADHRFYNVAAYFSEGRVLHVHRKVYLPSYGLFEEGLFMAPGASFRAFDTGLGRLGLLVCEDAWHLSAGYSYFLQNVDYLVVVSSSPELVLPAAGEEPSSARTWNSLLVTAANFFNVACLFVNRVGYEDGVKFWGGSKIVAPDGQFVASAGQVEPELCFGEVDPARIRLARMNLPMRRDERPELLRDVIEGLGCEEGVL
ncbi:MAG: hypothetical protein CSA62_02695 [Planctomycetota bacterium]|nr:MAG: hypothetical protein CSA62_02695 [Planctomycetota bacterium]